MRPISNRIYLDYNATSPLAENVITFFGSGDFDFLNPAALHRGGQEAKRALNTAIQSITQCFSISLSDAPQSFRFLAHSGSTEGLSLFFKGHGLYLHFQKESGDFYFAQSDHSAVLQQKSFLEHLGHRVFLLPIDKNGGFDCEQWISLILQNSGKKAVFLNYTWANNENGRHWPLSSARQIKERTGCTIHIDGAQVPFKIEHWNHIDSELDAYTFSSHKFGGLKGHGFSFVKNNFAQQIVPLFDGGGQQLGLRSGTENVLGTVVASLALQQKPSLTFAQLEQGRDNIQEFLLKQWPKIEILAQGAPHRLCNTIGLVLDPPLKAQELMQRFDLQGVQVGVGAACSSGLGKASHVLLSMGFPEDKARNFLRFSFSPFSTQNDLEKINSALQNFHWC